MGSDVTNHPMLVVKLITLAQMPTTRPVVAKPVRFLENATVLRTSPVTEATKIGNTTGISQYARVYWKAHIESGIKESVSAAVAVIKPASASPNELFDGCGGAENAGGWGGGATCDIVMCCGALTESVPYASGGYCGCWEVVDGGGGGWKLL